mgnify:CR=1 FL=1
MRALVTAFEPFGGSRTNASLAAVALLPHATSDIEIVTAQLPTSYARAGERLLRELAHAEPQIVLCVGEAGERHQLNVERIAVNLQDARLADNDGGRPVDSPVVADGPAAYFATLPVRAIHDALIAARIPAVLSNSAGTFVCNHVFYTLMRHAAQTRATWRGGFVHVPAWRDNDAAPVMSLDDIVQGLLIALATSAADLDSLNPKS